MSTESCRTRTNNFSGFPETCDTLIGLKSKRRIRGFFREGHGLEVNKGCKAITVLNSLAVQI